jgi:hypothetical protein
MNRITLYFVSEFGAVKVGCAEVEVAEVVVRTMARAGYTQCDREDWRAKRRDQARLEKQEVER